MNVEAREEAGGDIVADAEEGLEGFLFGVLGASGFSTVNDTRHLGSIVERRGGCVRACLDEIPLREIYSQNEDLSIDDLLAT